MSSPALSVLIPSHGGAHRLPETLDALDAAERPDGGLEVLVADDGSHPPIQLERPDGTALGLRLLRLERNQGRAAACNLALESARGELLLVLDDDMTVARDTLRGHVAAHGESHGVAVIGRIDPDPACFTGRFGRFLAAEERSRREDLLRAADAVPFTHCLTGHFSIRREDLLRAGGYSGAFARYGFEDIELAHRLERGGLRLVFRDDLKTTHRSEHADFVRHCERHFESGAMAVVFSRVAGDARVNRFLRVDGMRVAEQSGAFRRLMALFHQLARGCPRQLVPLLLGWARLKVAAGELLLPERLLHVGYHLARDMHYAAGIAAELRRERQS